MEENTSINKIPEHVGWYFSGFSDGEGSFNVSVKRISSHKFPWKLAASFNVSQRDKTVLLLLQKYLGCGTLRTRADGVVYFEVTNIRDLNEKIIPFFDRFKIMSENKQRNYKIFRLIVVQMMHGVHKTLRGFNSIIALRETLNEGRGRKRKYTERILRDYTPELVHESGSRV